MHNMLTGQIVRESDMSLSLLGANFQSPIPVLPSPSPDLKGGQTLPTVPTPKDKDAGL